jgi:hypothetical protein
MTRALPALLLSLLLTASVPEAPVTQSILGMPTTIGDVPLDQLGPWLMPFEDYGLWEVDQDDAVEFEASGGFLFVRPQVVEGLAPTGVISSVPRYKLLGSGALGWRWRPLDLANEGHQYVEFRSNYSAGGVGFFIAWADVGSAFADPAEARWHVAFTDSPSVSETVTVEFDIALHRWALIEYDPDAGKVRWRASGIEAGPYVTVLEVDAPSDTLALTGLRILASWQSGDTGVGGSGGEVSAFFGPWNERPSEHSLPMPTSILPLPSEGPFSTVQLLTQIGDDPPENPDDEE